MRGPKKQFEMLWRGAKSYGSSADVLAGNFASGVHPLSSKLNLASHIAHWSICLGMEVNNDFPENVLLENVFPSATPVSPYHLLVR